MSVSSVRPIVIGYWESHTSPLPVSPDLQVQLPYQSKLQLVITLRFVLCAYIYTYRNPVFQTETLSSIPMAFTRVSMKSPFITQSNFSSSPFPSTSIMSCE